MLLIEDRDKHFRMIELAEMGFIWVYAHRTFDQHINGLWRIETTKKPSLARHFSEPKWGDPLIQADVNQRKPPFGLPALSACILRPLAPQGIALMLEARAEVKLGAVMAAFGEISLRMRATIYASS